MVLSLYRTRRILIGKRQNKTLILLQLLSSPSSLFLILSCSLSREAFVLKRFSQGDVSLGLQPDKRSITLSAKSYDSSSSNRCNKSPVRELKSRHFPASEIAASCSIWSSTTSFWIFSQSFLSIAIREGIHYPEILRLCSIHSWIYSSFLSPLINPTSLALSQIHLDSSILVSSFSNISSSIFDTIFRFLIALIEFSITYYILHITYHISHINIIK